MNRTRHGRSPTGAISLCRTLRAGVAPALFCGWAMLVCGCGREQARLVESSDRAEGNPPVLDAAAMHSARPIENAGRPPMARPATVAGVRSVRQPDWEGSETQAEFRLAPDALPPTDADSELFEAVCLPPVEAGNESDDAVQREQVEPLDDLDSRGDGDSRGEAPGPALETVKDSRPTAMRPDFAAAFAVPRQQSIDVDDRLAPLSGPSEPTPALIAVARQADAHTARGFELAQRGATYTARAEFLGALRLSVAALDAQRQTIAHSRAMVNGLRALEEAEDFLAGVAIGQSLSVEAVVRGHRTPILHDEFSDELTPSQALQRYLTYAQDQLAAAAGDLQPAATALYALGKLETIATAAEIGSLPSARAAVYLQAALIVNPQHALAANELGVLLARHGRLEEAKAALLYSVQSMPQAAAWRNLAIVHHDLGELDLAGRADWESRQVATARQNGRPWTAGQSEQTAAAQAVEWVDPATFVKSTNATSGVPLPAAISQPGGQARTAAAKTAAQHPTKSSTKSASAWWRSGKTR